jgi:hypothetical protein
LFAPQREGAERRKRRNCIEYAPVTEHCRPCDRPARLTALHCGVIRWWDPSAPPLRQGSLGPGRHLGGATEDSIRGSIVSLEAFSTHLPRTGLREPARGAPSPFTSKLRLQKRPSGEWDDSEFIGQLNSCQERKENEIRGVRVNSGRSVEQSVDKPGDDIGQQHCNDREPGVPHPFAVYRVRNDTLHLSSPFVGATSGREGRVGQRRPSEDVLGGRISTSNSKTCFAEKLEGYVGQRTDFSRVQ